MNVQITSRKFRAKENLKTEIKEQLQSLEKFNDEILDANVILSYTHLKDSLKTVEITLTVPGKIFTAQDTSDDYGKSLIKVMAKLQRQLKTLKSKRIAKTR
jgi:putative sigma-54 modulation protein